MAFSVLMSVYKKEEPKYLREALDSVTGQTLLPNEIVLIKDGPLTDELEQVIAEYQEKYPFFQIFAFKENVQLGRALAKGVEICSYDLIARMDTDDIAVKDRFEKQYKYMEEHQQISACGGYMQEFSDDGSYNKTKKMPLSQEEIVAYAKLRNPLNHMTVMFRKSTVLEAGNYEHFPFLEDYHLWSRMLAKGNEFANLPEILVEARTGGKLYERRGGKSYFKQYILLRRLQKEWGLIKGFSYCKALILTALMTLQPSGLRKFVYRKILRK